MVSTWARTKGPVGWGKDGAYRGGDHLALTFGNPGQHVSHEMDPAPLPGHASHGGIDGVHQAAVVVGDHQLGPA